MAGDSPSQEGRDEPEYPKPRISSQVIPSLDRPLWIGLGYCPRMTTHWPRWFWPPGLAAGKGWWWEVSPSPDGLRSTSVESAGQRHWRDPARTDIKDRLDETRGITPDNHAPPGDASPYGLSSGGSGGFKPWWFYWARNWVDPA